MGRIGSIGELGKGGKKMRTFGLVRLPGNQLVNGIRDNDLPAVDTGLAGRQHENYRDALRQAGLEVIVLNADEQFPDGPFVEDAAVVLGRTLVITRPGDGRRRGEEEAVENRIRGFFEETVRITEPGCLDGGDVLVMGHQMWIGISGRTNRQGADQLKKLGEERGYRCRVTEVRKGLHLKTYVGAPGMDRLWIHPDIAHDEAFDNIEKFVVDEADGYACNCRSINGHTVMAAGFPRLEQWCEQQGLKPVPVPMSEYRKLDGGISCLSIVW